MSKVHREVLRFVREGYEIVYIGHRGHDEAVGVIGESPEHVHLIEHERDVDDLDFSPDQKLVLLSQTTLSVDETTARSPHCSADSRGLNCRRARTSATPRRTGRPR